MPNKRFERQICNRQGVSFWFWSFLFCWRARAGFLRLDGSSSGSSSSAERLVVSESAEIADTAEEMAEAKSETLVALIPDFLPLEEPVPRSFPGFLSCQCLAFLAGVNLAYSASG